MATPGVITQYQLNDLQQTTLPWLGRGRFTDIVSPLQRHTAMKNLLRRNRIKVSSGRQVNWRVMVNPANAASNVGFGAPDAVKIVDLFTNATADWRNTTASYGMIGQEIDMNAEPARIFDEMLGRRIGAMQSLVEIMERNFWGPPVALADNLTPWGIKTWIVKNATEGFNGGAPSGYTTIGLNPTTYPNWNNYTFPYSAVSPDDFVVKLSKACEFTNFEPPVENEPTFNTGNDWGMYTNWGLLGPTQQLLRASNDNLGEDLLRYDGSVMVRRVPLVRVPILDADLTNPIYGLQWGEFKTFVLNNWWLRETHLPYYPGQHTMAAHFLDCTYQFVALNRRTSFVGSNGVTYPN